ncbi:hypothetical protein AWH69_08585 [Janibacter melonis]|uniref:Uncharacterized protein n=1 Tax=Janibacter melonis TaxID=262209 RepID=A0A176QED4_9MICO|nr:hypothetical protein [Janibacter melonis]MBD5829456.1 hypothetical protein [Janibacter melonis]OAB88044.1 hypothetical protein AWH69_08585 [Janibacter melonis]
MRGLLATRARISGASTGWWLLLPLVWLTVPLLALVALPPVDPTLETQARPLEQLSSMALVLGVSHLCWALGDSASWIAAISPRSARHDRALRGLALIGLGLVACLAASLLLPDGVTPAHTTLVGMMLLGLGVGSSVVVGRLGSAIAPAAAVGTASLGGAAIWPWNAIFNLDSSPDLRLLAPVVLVGGLAAFVWCDERGARRSRLGLATSTDR